MVLLFWHCDSITRSAAAAAAAADSVLKQWNFIHLAYVMAFNVHNMCLNTSSRAHTSSICDSFVVGGVSASVPFYGRIVPLAF